MAETNSNGRITLALISKQIEDQGTEISEVKGSVKTVDSKMSGLHDFMTRQDELNKAIKAQLWNKDGDSRVQCAENTANSAMSWAKGALVPIALALVVGIISLLYQILK